MAFVISSAGRASGSFEDIYAVNVRALCLFQTGYNSVADVHYYGVGVRHGRLDKSVSPTSLDEWRLHRERLFQLGIDQEHGNYKHICLPFLGVFFIKICAQLSHLHVGEPRKSQQNQRSGC